VLDSVGPTQSSLEHAPVTVRVLPPTSILGVFNAQDCKLEIRFVSLSVPPPMMLAWKITSSGLSGSQIHCPLVMRLGRKLHEQMAPKIPAIASCNSRILAWVSVVCDHR